MPNYEYQCDACQAEFETFQSIHDEALVDCPKCEKPKLYRLITGAGIIFKGSGFYVNDSKKAAEKTATAKKPPEANANANIDTSTSTSTSAGPKTEKDNGKQSDKKVDKPADTTNSKKSDKKSDAAS